MRANTGNASRVAVRDAPFIPGSVCWVDVSTTDPARSQQFYSELFGWTYEIASRPGRQRYMTASRDGRPVAGLAEVPIRAGHPAAWTLYLASRNVKRTAQLLRKWGGRVLVGPTDAGQGSVFIGVDPTGGAIGFWQPARPWTFGRISPGSLYWAGLDTWDGMRADAFFASLFGQQQQIRYGIDVDYTTWSVEGQTMLGRLQMNRTWADPRCAARWMLHFTVDPHIGTDAAVDRVLALGGRVDADPYDTELGRIARVRDPSGAAFALIDPTNWVDGAADLAAGSARVDDPYDD